MHVVVFCHSLVSDWNHGSAHFLRGIVSELLADGHTVDVYEPEDGWSRRNLQLDQGEAAFVAFATRFPALHSKRYRPGGPNLDRALGGADVVLVHEWTGRGALVAAIGAHRATQRALSAALPRHAPPRRLDLAPRGRRSTSRKLATPRSSSAACRRASTSGAVLIGHARLHLARGRGRGAGPPAVACAARARPRARSPAVTDLVWIGNWGDEERSAGAELEEFLLRPIRDLGLSATIYGVRYPARVRAALERAGAVYRGYLPNHAVPAAFSRGRLTIHVPRRLYARESLPGSPQRIRPFEALACGVPLVSAPWDDVDHLRARPRSRSWRARAPR